MTLRVMSWLALAAIGGACSKKPVPVETVNGNGSNTAPAPAPTPTAPTTPTAAAVPIAPTGAPSSTLDSKPFVLTCGDKPLVLPPPAAMPPVVVERPLEHDKPISVCLQQDSPEAVCACLVGKIAAWADGFHAPTCKPLDAYRTAHAQLLQIISRPPDPESTAGGVMFVLAGMRGSKWSVIDTIDSAPEIDLGVTPHASNDAAIDRFEIRQQPDATLVWIESRHETEETAMGERTRTGEASTTVCVVPTAAAARAFCYASVPRSAWYYTEAIVHRDAGCTIQSATSFDDHLEAGVLTVRLTHGTDLKPVGQFRL